MPQLDQFTYLTQFMWLCIFYMTFYVLLFNDGLPKISRILKLRAHLSSNQTGDTNTEEDYGKSNNITGASNSFTSLEGAERKTGVFPQDVIFQTLNSSVSYLNSTVSHTLDWCTNSVQRLNANQLKSVNKSYLRSIGEISASQLIKENALEANAPLTCSSPSTMSLEISQVWALRLQKCLLNSINKKKKRK